MQRLWLSILQSFHALSPARRRFVLIAGSLAALCLLTLLTTSRNEKLSPSHTPATANQTVAGNAEFLPEESYAGVDHKEVSKIAALPAPDYDLHGTRPLSAAGEPRIAYAAELAVLTKEFAHSRSSMEEILERHRGYTAKLRMVGQTSGSTLSATLKIPASEYASALADLKSVGNVERDEEVADEIVQQRGDLEARLQNAQNTERRFQQLLKDRNSRSTDLASMQRQLAALHNDIAQLEAQRNTFDNRVVFSNIHFALREERIIPAESISAQLRGAVAAGLSDAAHSLSALLLILATYGPSFLLWAAILFFPVRKLWRRWHLSYPRAQAA